MVNSEPKFSMTSSISGGWGGILCKEYPNLSKWMKICLFWKKKLDSRILKARPRTYYFSFPFNFLKYLAEQECIAVRCVPSAAVANSGGGGLPGGMSAQEEGCLPGESAGGICPGGGVVVDTIPLWDQKQTPPSPVWAGVHPPHEQND